MKKQLLTTFLLIALIATSFAATADSQHSVGFGIFSEHYIEDSPRFNEKNELAYYHYQSGKDVAVIGTFKNSYFIRSHVVAAGKEYRGPLGSKIGVMLGLVEGYETVLETNCGSKLMCVPLVYVKTGIFTHMIMGPAYNLSITVEL
tara:strand:- start:246 stop:683 length:438 start_codon:yes stop_codon:yes gene_type:complete